jgi:DNA polymerase III epsilon subunit-like protein
MFDFVDTETTGFPKAGIQPHIVSIAWMIADNPASPRVFRSQVIFPQGYKIPFQVSRIHGITTEIAQKKGKPLQSVMRAFATDILTLLPRAIVAHNAAFDLPIFGAGFERAWIANPCANLPAICTMMVARQKWPGSSAKLGDVYARLF